MDENQIGPNMHTTPVQRYVRDGTYPSAKAVPCNLKVLGSNPKGRQSEDHRQDQRYHGKVLFCFFFCSDFILFILFVWDPRECTISAHSWAS